MNKLFWSRMLLYGIAVGVPLLYPGVVVAYDRVSLLTWFVYVPLMMCAAGFVRPPQWRLRTSLLWPVAMSGLFSFFAGWNLDGLVLTGVGLLSWVLTVLIFAGGYRGTGVAVLEVFAIAAVYYRLLSFARASEDVARSVSAWLVPLSVLAMAAFLLHGLLIYLSAFPDRGNGKRHREVLIFFGAAVPVSLTLLLFLPVDFVRNDVVLNQFFEEAKMRELLPSDRKGEDDRGGPSSGEEPGEKSGLPLGGRKSTTPRLPDGSSVDEGTDTRIREFRADEHRGGQGSPRRREEGSGDSGGGARERDPSRGGSGGASPRREPESGSKAEGQGQGREQGRSGTQGQNESPKPDGGKRSGSGGVKPDAGKSESGKTESGKSESGKSESGKTEAKPQNGRGEGQGKEESKKDDGPKDGKKQSQGDDKKPGKSGPPPPPPKKERKNRLRGTSPDNYKPRWSRETDSSDGEGGYQFALMIVASPVEPVYSAESYWSDFDPKTGFRAAPDDIYNQVGRARLLETWTNPNTLPDEKRKTVEIRYLSAIPERVVPYVPEMLEPTKLSARYRPFDLSYRARARVSTSGPEDWKEVPDLRESEKKDLAVFLKADLSAAQKAPFQKALHRALKGKRTYYERLDAVQRMVSGYQYELGFDEDTTIAKLSEFFTKTKTGDCTEFSHVTALLARMAGIPARVVTGYVAGKGTQTPAHRRGLVELRKRIEPLQNIPLDQLYLVTSSHRHAWAQFYIPGYGWVDIETTAYAKPPKPQFDPNNRDVVIPLIEKEQLATPPAAQRKIDWRAVTFVAGLVVLAFLLLLYVYRYSRELYLLARSRGRAPQAMESLYRLSLLRLAARGYPLKEPHETPLEYSRRVPELRALSARLNEYRFRERLSDEDRRAMRADLRGLYRAVWKRVKAGTLGALGRAFSLRPLYY